MSQDVLMFFFIYRVIVFLFEILIQIKKSTKQVNKTMQGEHHAMVISLKKGLQIYTKHGKYAYVG